MSTLQISSSEKDKHSFLKGFYLLLQFTLYNFNLSIILLTITIIFFFPFLASSNPKNPYNKGIASSEEILDKYINEPFNSETQLIHNNGVNPKDLIEGIINSIPSAKGEFETTEQYISRCEKWEISPFLGKISFKSEIAFVFNGKDLLNYNADTQTMSSIPFNDVNVFTLNDKDGKINNTTVHYKEIIRVMIDDAELPTFSFNINQNDAPNIKYNSKIFLIGYLSFPYINTEILPPSMLTGEGHSVLYYSKTKSINILFAVKELLVVSQDGVIICRIRYDMTPKSAPISEMRNAGTMETDSSEEEDRQKNEDNRYNDNANSTSSGQDTNHGILNIIKSIFTH